eukprot:Hpha_TRINITY_DN9249_c0_g1::TRINITY_DN9249_c0_g1_i1::g.28502::m.28502/K01674/cah; carbonic anhydrase
MRGVVTAFLLPLVAGQWSYDPTSGVGPWDWWQATAGGHLECTGMQQSPVDIDVEAADPAIPGFLQLWVPLEPSGRLQYLENTGRGVALNLTERGVLLTSSSLQHSMRLTWVHFRTRSEHRLNGKQFVMEMHLEFSPADSRHVEGTPAAQREPKTIIAVLFDLDTRGAPSSPLADFVLDKVPLVEGAERGRAPVLWDTALGADFRTMSGIGNASTWLDGIDKDEYAEYDGSLTEPPCTETVRWMVNLRPRRISQTRLSRLEAIINSRYGNSRPVQPVNGRRVLRRRFFGPVHPAHETEFSELKVVLTNFRSTAGSSPSVERLPDPSAADESTTKGLLAAVIVLGVAVVLTVVGIFVTITVRRNEPADLMDDGGASFGDVDEEDEEGEEGEEEEEGSG